MPSDKFTVFYAWQSDSATRDNRNFIESALEAALKKIQKSGTIESSPRLDKDTKDVPGIPDIANTILEKIRGSDCFLCDVSFVGSTHPEDAEDEELLPNPNVMIELGYALSELGWERIVLVINNATGSAEDLPFDLRNRRWPIAYELNAHTDEVARSEEKLKLTKHIQTGIEAIAKLPPRQKRGTTEQRLDALEEIVGKLSGNVSQYTTMANLVAGLQRASTESARAGPDAEAQCLDLRSSLINTLLAGDFENVAVRQGMLVITICPSSVPSPLPLFEGGNETMLRLQLRPLYASGWDHQRYGERFVTSSKWNEDIDAATEITIEGNIRAAGHKIIAVGREFLNDGAPDDVLFIPSVAFEKSIIGAVCQYLKALKSLGTEGPWFLGLGIAKVHRSQLIVGPRFDFGGRIFEGDEILPPVIEIAPNAEVDDHQTIARALRPAFDYVWREHNYPQSLNYAETGDWIGH